MIASRIWSRIRKRSPIENVLRAYGVTRTAGTSGHRVHRVYEVRHDLRSAFPLALTPAQRPAYLEWLLAVGRSELDLSDNEILAFLRDCERDPSHGIAKTYLLTPDWQRAVPHGLTASGWGELLRYIATTHGITDRWLRNAKRPNYLRDDNGVNILGHFRYPSGLGEAVRQNEIALQRSGFRTTRRDLPITFDCDWSDRADYLDVEPFDITLINTTPFTFAGEELPRCGLHLRQGVYRIASWFWELESFPDEPITRLGPIDEIWAPTEFIANSVRTKLQDKPVISMLPGIETPPPTHRTRTEFGLRDDATVFLFMFDMSSVFERKNPLAIIEAYRKAFRPDENVQLVIKVSRGDRDPTNLVKLLASGITVIDRMMSREESFGLLHQCDCVVSLHRSEGLGLSLGEGMLLGKPVIATGYSGNVDFMPADATLLVDYRRVMIEHDIPPYPRGAIWAEPDVEHAARHMRWVHDHRAAAKALGEKGREAARKLISPEAAGRRMADRITAIREARR